jgi:hypothetical protein
MFTLEPKFFLRRVILRTLNGSKMVNGSIPYKLALKIFEIHWVNKLTHVW